MKRRSDSSQRARWKPIACWRRLGRLRRRYGAIGVPLGERSPRATRPHMGHHGLREIDLEAAAYFDRENVAAEARREAREEIFERLRRAVRKSTAQVTPEEAAVIDLLREQREERTLRRHIADLASIWPGQRSCDRAIETVQGCQDCGGNRPRYRQQQYRAHWNSSLDVRSRPHRTRRRPPDNDVMTRKQSGQHPRRDQQKWAPAGAAPRS